MNNHILRLPRINVNQIARVCFMEKQKPQKEVTHLKKALVFKSDARQAGGGSFHLSYLLSV